MKKVENGDRGCDVLLLAQAMAKILQEKIEVSMNGELTEITYAEALARRTLHDAMNGKQGARRDVLELERIADHLADQAWSRDLNRAVQSLLQR